MNDFGTSQSISTSMSTNANNHVNTTSSNTTTASTADASSSTAPLPVTLLLPPPSKVSSDGSFVYPPSLLSKERDYYFAQKVAQQKLILSNTDNTKKSQEHHDDDDKTDTKSTSKPKIHPLAIASARIRSKGIDELSKAINLAGLVLSGEYFGLTNIVQSALSEQNHQEESQHAEKVDTKNMNMNTIVTSSSSNLNSNHTQTQNRIPQPQEQNIDSDGQQEVILYDSLYRSKFILERKKLTFATSAQTIRNHYKTCFVATQYYHSILHERYLQLRQKWYLVIPERSPSWKGSTPMSGSTKTTIFSIRPSEIVAIDLNMYQDSPTLDSTWNPNTHENLLMKIPKHAVLDLHSDFQIVHYLRKNVDKDGDISSTPYPPPQNHDTIVHTEHPCPSPRHVNSVSQYTEAKPYLVFDPTLHRTLDTFMQDVKNTPLLTLLFQIEKTSNGFHVSQTSDCIYKNDPNHNKSSSTYTKSSSSSSTTISSSLFPMESNDERFLNSLQHSLFCTQLFESLREEILRKNYNRPKKQYNPQQKQQANYLFNLNPVAWLSSEMDETFLPSSSVMAGIDGRHRSFQKSSLLSLDELDEEEEEEEEDQYDILPLFCLVHCHQGEIKVLLDSEYSLSIQLVDCRTLSQGEEEAVVVDGENNNDDDKSKNNNDETLKSPVSKKLKREVNNCSDNTIETHSNEDLNTAHMSTTLDSGSQSQERLQLLCRLLLYHAQSRYHRHRRKVEIGLLSSDGQSHVKEQTKTQVNYFSSGHSSSTSLVNKQVGQRSSDASSIFISSPRILQSCVGLGTKILLENKVRMCLKNIALWLAHDMERNDKLHVLWLPTSIFDLRSQFSLSIGDSLSLDVTIECDTMRVSSLSDQNDYRTVRFASCEDFDNYLRMEIVRFLLA